MSWNISAYTAEKFFEICESASVNDNVFSTFKSHPDFRQVLEHVDKEHGELYLSLALDKCSYLEKYMSQFEQNDLVGGPITYKYYNWSLSPTTCRYIKVLSDLIYYFHDLGGLNIAEIGCGYGGQCKIISDVFKFKHYTLFDNPHVNKLQDKYIKKFNIEGANFDILNGYDVVISNYALDELSGDLQKEYFDRVISKSKNGYFTFASPIDIGHFPKNMQITSQQHIYDLPYHKLVTFKESKWTTTKAF